MIRSLHILFVLALCASLAAADTASSSTLTLAKREHPFLFASRRDFDRAKAHAQNDPWMRSELAKLLSQADQALTSPLVVPKEGGQWPHYYSCPKCGDALQTQAPNKHLCPNCKAVYSGWPYDQVAFGNIHEKNVMNLRTLGLAYAFTSNEAYAKKAREILLAYAQAYPNFVLHDYQGKQGPRGARLCAQTLDEAVSMVNVAWGYDLVYNSPCLSEQDKASIEKNFLRESAHTLQRFDAGVSNWQTWHNAALAAIGFCLNDASLAGDALYGKSGLQFQLSKSVLKDGFWYEGSPHYHYYALEALWWTGESAYQAGIDFYKDPVFRSLFDAPLPYVMPNGKYPAINDSDSFALSDYQGLYEPLFARTRDAKYLMALVPNRPNGLNALLWGSDSLPAAAPVPSESKDFEGLGAAVLRQGSGPQQSYVHLDYGPHGGAHGHPDKLALILFSRGQMLAPDPGALRYSVPLHETWYRQSIAHNTVTVDGRSQLGAQGKLCMFGSHTGFSLAQAECDKASTGVLMRRTVALTPDYMIDVFSLESEREHTYDWAYHNFGKLTPGTETTPRTEPLGKGQGYQHISQLSEAQTSATWSADFALKDTTVRLTMLGGQQTGLYFGMGMSELPPTSCPMVLARRTARKTTFVSVIEPFDGKPKVTSVRCLGQGQEASQPLAIEITCDGRREYFSLSGQKGLERQVGSGVFTRARACFVQQHDDGQAPHVFEVE